MDVVEKFIAEKYSNNLKVRTFLTDLYRQYNSWGLKDGKFEKDFIDGTDEHFYGYLWEMFLARHLKDIGLDISSANEGPDFKICYEGRTVWVEAICPSPPKNFDYISLSDHKNGIVTTEYKTHMLLRWTSAIKEKKEKLEKYMEKGIVKECDPYVIALNSCRLWIYDENNRLDEQGLQSRHIGISGKPFVLEAVYPIGSPQVHFKKIGCNKKELTKKGMYASHRYRFEINKSNGAKVPTDNFLNSEYKHVSAILGTPADVDTACGAKHPIAVVHNHLAINKLPINILRADEEYITEDKGDDWYEINQFV